MRFIFLSITLFSITATATDLGNIDQFIERQMRNHNVPGVAVGVVENGNATYKKGYGYRDVENRLSVNTQTLFGLGSLSKAFTALGALKLVEEGQLQLNTPVKNQWSDFQLSTTVATDQATVIDLLSHQTGQGVHDTMWLGSRTPMFELFKRLPFLEANEIFRHGYQYNNLMFMAAGRVMEVMSARTWREIIEEEIFQKLGMDSSNTSTTLFRNNFAYPYWYNGQSRLNKRPVRVTDNMGPAASVNSNIEDLTKWMNFIIYGQNSSGVEIVSPSLLNEWTSSRVFAYASHAPAYSDTYYALGWRTGTYRGHRMWRHGGSIGSYLSYIFILPDLETGVIVLQNTDEESITSTIGEEIIDRILDVRKNQNDEREELLAIDGEWQKRKTPRALPVSVADMEKYRGSYRNAGYGDLRISVINNVAKVYYNDWVENFVETAQGTLEATGEHFDSATVKFNSSGDVDEIALPLDSRTQAIVFQKLY